MSTSARFAPSAISRSHNKKCVCEICKCGGHKCPSGQNKYPDNLIKTTFQKDYIKFNVSPEKPFSNKNKFKEYPYEKDQLRSQYNSEYVKFPIERDPAFKTAYNAIQNDVPFPKKSEYSNNYDKMPNAKRNPFHQSEIKKLQMPFMGRSTYRNDFNKHGSVPKTDKLDRTNYNKNSNWISNNSTYQKDFQKWGTGPAKLIEQPLHTKGSPPLDGMSMYKSHYVGFDPRIYDRDVCPIDQLPPRPRNLNSGHDHLCFESEKMTWE